MNRKTYHKYIDDPDFHLCHVKLNSPNTSYSTKFVTLHISHKLIFEQLYGNLHMNFIDFCFNNYDSHSVGYGCLERSLLDDVFIFTHRSWGCKYYFKIPQGLLNVMHMIDVGHWSLQQPSAGFVCEKIEDDIYAQLVKEDSIRKQDFSMFDSLMDGREDSVVLDYAANQGFMINEPSKGENDFDIKES